MSHEPGSIRRIFLKEALLAPDGHLVCLTAGRSDYQEPESRGYLLFVNELVSGWEGVEPTVPAHMMPNLIDTKSIDDYLDALVPAQPEVQRLLKIALAKPLAKRPENLEPVTELPSDAPAWLKAKWPEGGPYHRFRPDDKLTNKARHVADWLKVAVQDQEPWLKQRSHGRPTRFNSINSLDDALAMADADMREKNRKLAKQRAPSAEGEETVMDLGNGFRIVRLTTPTALDRESAFMGHCIGQGGYDEYLKDGSRQFFSLRDAKNLPHATIEVDTARHAVLQCQGKENKPPVAKYLPRLQRFLTERKYKLNAPPNDTGLIEQDGQYHSIFAMPQGLKIHGDLNLGDTRITSLPEGLEVPGNLDLIETPITSLPEGLEVGGSLSLINTSITSLPKGLKVGGGLHLKLTSISSLPEGLDVPGDLDLSNTPITSLPKRLKVGGSLDLRNTLIAFLPEDLVVKGRIIPNDKLHISKSGVEVQSQLGTFQDRVQSGLKPSDAGPNPS